MYSRCRGGLKEWSLSPVWIRIVLTPRTEHPYHLGTVVENELELRREEDVISARRLATQSDRGLTRWYISVVKYLSSARNV